MPTVQVWKCQKCGKTFEAVLRATEVWCHDGSHNRLMKLVEGELPVTPRKYTKRKKD